MLGQRLGASYLIQAIGLKRRNLLLFLVLIWACQSVLGSFWDVFYTIEDFIGFQNIKLRMRNEADVSLMRILRWNHLDVVLLLVEMEVVDYWCYGVRRFLRYH